MTTEIFNKLYFRLPRAEIGHLRFILESYDGLAFSRTLDKHQGLVEIACSASRSCDLEGLLKALATEIDLQQVDTPEVIPPL